MPGTGLDPEHLVLDAYDALTLNPRCDLGSFRPMPGPYVLRHLGRERRYSLDERAIVVTDAATSAERRIDLDSIRSVRVARIGTLHICALTLANGQEDTIATDESASRPAFAELIRALHAQLRTRDVPFASGSWLVASIVATGCVVMLALGLALYLGVIDAPAFRTRGMVLALVSLVLGPVGAWTSRPRTVRSDAELAAALPR